jgi:hypothetical protein
VRLVKSLIIFVPVLKNRLMKTRGVMEVKPHALLNSALDKGKGQLHDPAVLLLGKKTSAATG